MHTAISLRLQGSGLWGNKFNTLLRVVGGLVNSFGDI